MHTIYSVAYAFVYAIGTPLGGHMAIVNFLLSDFSSDPMVGLKPRLVFTPSSGAVSSDVGVFAPQKRYGYPNADGAGSVQLIENKYLRPATWYDVSVEVADANAFDVDRGYALFYKIPGRLVVPDGGGNLGKLMQAPWNPALGWYGPEEPPGIPVLQTLWLDSDTGILYSRTKI
jgi:hypothetical protein